MNFNIISDASPEQITADCLVVAVLDTKLLCENMQLLDQASKKYITRIIETGDLADKTGSVLLLHQVPGIAASRLLIVRLAPADRLKPTDVRHALRCITSVLLGLPIASATFLLPQLANPQLNANWIAREAMQILINQSYRFDHFKSESPSPFSLQTIIFAVPDRLLKEVQQGAKVGAAIANAVTFSKNLANLPSNVCTPTYLADTAQQLVKASASLSVDVLKKPDLEALGMGAFLAVTRGSAEPPAFIVLRYKGHNFTQNPIVLIGKGITFDTGGISLKPAEKMDEMKYDMCGASTVLGVIQAAIALQLPLDIIGIVASCENMPSGTATKPGDIVQSLSGQSIEILNTDAEGRLILCDALTYAKQFKPACVIDIATLTGACVIALGHVASGLFSNDDTLAKSLCAASEITDDKVWRLPLFSEYKEQLKSNFADIANIGGRAAGSITAASFLAQFTQEYKWAHLDIAGTAWESGEKKGATGRPIPLLVEFLLQESQKNST